MTEDDPLGAQDNLGGGDESTDAESKQTALRHRSRQLAEESVIGVLGTIDGDGYPYTSVVEVVFDGDDGFYLLLSDLAVHTRNLRRDERASLLLREEAVDQEVLNHRRGSFLGRVIKVENREDEVRAKYLTAHPRAVNFVDFSDFNFYRLAVDKVRFIAGFGQMGWVDGQALGEPGDGR